MVSDQLIKLAACTLGARRPAAATPAPHCRPCRPRTLWPTLLLLAGCCPLFSQRQPQLLARSRSVKAAAASASQESATAAAATAASTPLRTLHPSSQPFKSGNLEVSDLHTLYYEVHGNPHGVPALFLHGGPGAGCYPNHG